MPVNLDKMVDIEIKTALKNQHDEKLKLTDFKSQNTDRRLNKPRTKVKGKESDEIVVGGVKLIVGLNCKLKDEDRQQGNFN